MNILKRAETCRQNEHGAQAALTPPVHRSAPPLPYLTKFIFLTAANVPAVSR